MTTKYICNESNFSTKDLDVGNLLKNNIIPNMEAYYKQAVGGDPMRYRPLINAFNKSVGANTINTPFVVFFQDNSFQGNSFDRTIMYNFWTNNDKTINTQEAIDLIGDFIVSLGDRAQPKNGDNSTQDVYKFFYSSFANPYCDFIVNYLMCGMGNNNNINFSISPNIVTNNLYRFLRETRGSGTKTLCSYCDSYFTNYLQAVKNKSGSDIYYDVAQNNNLNNFCGCCSQLIKYQPDYYQKAKDKNKGVSIILPCQTICHKNETIKARLGSYKLVNNGFSINQNLDVPQDEIIYLRRGCLNQTICVIDNINISIIGGNSKVEFNQVCPGCGEGGCICFLDLSDGSVTDTLAKDIKGFQDPVTFKQNCQVSLCSQQVQNENGVTETIFLPCNPFNSSDTGKNPNQNYNHDGQPSSNSSQQNRDKYIFGIQNWLVPILFVLIAVIVTISILIVNVKDIKREIEIYLIKPKSDFLIKKI
jgi:hypothetical protein